LVPPRAIEEIVVVPVPVEVIVTFWPALVEPVFVVAKVREGGDTLRDLVSTTPVPDRLTDWGLPVPSLVTVRLAARGLPAVGAKATVTVQDKLGVNAAGQVFAVIVKSPGLVPPNAIEEIVVVAVPVEVMVTFWPALVEPTFVFA
jgi:hypothetical protein